jgi:hypothetical protein
MYMDVLLRALLKNVRKRYIRSYVLKAKSDDTTHPSVPTIKLIIHPSSSPPAISEMWNNMLMALPILVWPYGTKLLAQGFLQNGGMHSKASSSSWNLYQHFPQPTDDTNSVLQKTPNKITRPVNEFSRTMQTDKVILTRREYSMQISADTNEMENLARRFSLPNITALHADLIITRAVDRQDSYSSKQSHRDNINLASCVQVEGTVRSSCYQTCVRTNENFSVDKEFALFAIIRPCSAIHQVLPRSTTTDTTSLKRGQVPKSKGRQKNDAIVQQQVNLVTLGGNLIDDQGYNDQDIMEDEAILGDNGILDVGELVAQMFRVKLDPYPKKKGTKPVSYSITG